MEKATYEKLRALLNKARDKGCTKAEAEAALDIARRLAIRFNVKLEEIDLDAEQENTEFDLDLVEITHEVFFISGMSSFDHPMNKLIPLIAHVCNIQVVFDDTRYRISKELADLGYTTENDLLEVHAFGPRRKIFLFRTVFEIMTSAIDTEWPKYRDREKAKMRKSLVKKVSGRAFAQGMAADFKEQTIDAGVIIKSALSDRQRNLLEQIGAKSRMLLEDKFPDTVVRQRKTGIDHSGSKEHQDGKKIASKYNIRDTLVDGMLGTKKLTSQSQKQITEV